MEEAIRKLYQEHHSDLQRKRIEQGTDSQDYYNPTPKNGYSREDSFLTSPSSIFELDEDIRFEKQFYQTKKFCHPDSVQWRLKKTKLPCVGRREKRRKLKVKLTSVFMAVLFTVKLKRRLRSSLLKRKQKASKYSQHLVNMVQKLIRDYYEKLLKQELCNYIHILDKYIALPLLDQEKQSIQFLYNTSAKLANSSLTRDILGFFVYIATQRGFPPSDFLSKAEINRLDFSPHYGCLINVTQEQTRMVIGLGLGIKIFCFYILYQPWNLSHASQLLKRNHKDVQSNIINLASIFYFILLEEFCLNLKETRTVSKSLIANFGIKPIKELNPFQEGVGASTSKSIITNQNKAFFSSIQLKYPALVKAIKQNLFKWISRISYACLKQSQKSTTLKDSTITFTSLNSSQAKPQRQRGKQFRSISLRAKRDQIVNEKTKHRYELPFLKQTIQ